MKMGILKKLTQNYNMAHYNSKFLNELQDIFFFKRFTRKVLVSTKRNMEPTAVNIISL